MTGASGHLNGRGARYQWEKYLRDLDLGPSVKLTALTLATYTNGEGQSARPGITRLTLDTGLSRRTVVRDLATLRALGLVERTHTGHGNQWASTADTYALTLPEDPPPW